MSSVNNTAKLIEIKKQTVEVESELKELLLMLTKPQNINFHRTDDYRKRGFQMFVYYDDINIEALKNIDKIKELYVRHLKLRTEQKVCEQEYNSEKAVQNIMVNDMRST